MSNFTLIMCSLVSTRAKAAYTLTMLSKYGSLTFLVWFVLRNNEKKVNHSLLLLFFLFQIQTILCKRQVFVNHNGKVNTTIYWDYSHYRKEIKEVIKISRTFACFYCVSHVKTALNRQTHVFHYSRRTPHTRSPFLHQFTAPFLTSTHFVDDWMSI